MSQRGPRRLSVLSGTVLLSFGIAACGGSPMAPPPPPPPPPVNTIPKITTIGIQGSRAGEPPNFADLGESVAVRAEVQDDETPVAQLQYLWTASVGTFSGSGASVTWQAPPIQPQAPVDVTIQLEVVERYGPPSAPLANEHHVVQSVNLRLHDSVTEVGDMARQFLLDFADSSIHDVAYVMRNFEPGCYGTQDETDQVALQRQQFRMVSSFVGPASVKVNFGGVCPYRARPGDACSQVPVVFDSIDIINNRHGPPARGTDQVAAVYVRSRTAWRLCDSQLNGDIPLHLRRLFR
jgi:hypothetical protein